MQESVTEDTNLNQLVPVLNTIQCGDSAFLLKQLPDNSIDLVVTSPPYYMQRGYNGLGVGLGQENTVDRYIDSLMQVFEEIVRVVKPTGNIVYNIGDKYRDSSLLLVPYRFALSVMDIYPVRLVNEITWVKKNPTPRQFSRRLVASTEPFFHFALCNDYYYDRGSFMNNEENVKTYQPTNRLGARYFDLIKGSNLSNTQKDNACKALEQVIAEVNQGNIVGFRMKIKGIHAEAFGGEGGGRKIQMDNDGFTVIRLRGKRIKRDVIESTVASVPGVKHTAMFPCSIICDFVKLLSPKNGIVLDPYIGSGTTAIAAIKESRQYVGFDIDPLYCDLAIQRIAECKI